jgi:flagellar biosynthesis GTPase FlhF
MNDRNLIYTISIGIGAGFASVCFAQLSDVQSIANRNILVVGSVNSIISQQQENNPANNSQPNSQPQTTINNESKLRESINQVYQAIGKMPENAALAIPFTSTNGASDISHLEVVEFINAQGQHKNITPQDVKDMLDHRVKNMEVADVTAALNQNNNLQNRKVPTFDLIIHNRKTSKTYIFKRVNANAFFRDTFYAFLKGTVRQI